MECSVCSSLTVCILHSKLKSGLVIERGTHVMRPQQSWAWGDRAEACGGLAPVTWHLALPAALKLSWKHSIKWRWLERSCTTPQMVTDQKNNTWGTHGSVSGAVTNLSLPRWCWRCTKIAPQSPIPHLFCLSRSLCSWINIYFLCISSCKSGKGRSGSPREARKTRVDL